MLAPAVARADAGKVTVSFMTQPTAYARYAPRNVLVVWVEDSSGKFVKTLLKYAARREAYLRAWQTTNLDRSMIPGMPDVVSGATRPSHAQRTVTWNQVDYTGAVVPNGTYKIKMELTDWDSSSTSGNNEGLVTVDVKGVESHTTPAPNGGFSAITVDYIPGGGSVTPTPDAGVITRPDGGTNPSPSPSGTPEPAMCASVTQCSSGDGCCPLDCVYEVDHDCNPDSAHAADAAPGCSTTGSSGGPGHAALAPLLLLGAVLLAAALRRRSRT